MNLNKTTDNIVIISPGRINLIGEHLDYNGGYVFPATINHNISLKFSRTQNNQCLIISEGFGSFKIDINDTVNISSNHWENYILGVIDGINKIRPNKLEGFNCNITGDLPAGAGIASSAALECGIAKGLNHLFNLKINEQDLINLCVKAEHNFVKIIVELWTNIPYLKEKLKSLFS